MQPAVADARGDELREAGIAHGDEPARRDAVGHVAKFFRPQLGEIAQHGLLQQLGVELGDAVDRVAADAGEMRHAHVAWPAFVDEREPRESRVVAGKSGAHFVEEAAVDLEDDLEMPRKQRAEEIDRPLLQRLGEQRVIRVGEGRASHRPRFVPAERVFVHEQAHQLRDGDRGVRVVELHGPFFVEGRGRAAEQRLDAQHVLQRAAREKELLLEPEHLALVRFVVRVEHFGDRLRLDFVLDRAVVVALVERSEVERLDGLGFPKPQRVAGANAVAGDRRVVGDAAHLRLWNPAHAEAALLVRPRLGAPAKLHLIRDLRARDIPRVAVLQPFVGHLTLPAVADDLIENAELVANAVAERRHFDRRERVHVTRRQSAQSAIAEAGLFFLRKNLVEIVAEPAHRFARGFRDAEVEQIVRKMRPEQELRGEIRHASRVRSAVVFDARDRAVEEPVADGQREREIEVVFRGNGFEAAHAADEVVAKGLLDFVGGETDADAGADGLRW